MARHFPRGVWWLSGDDFCVAGHSSLFLGFSSASANASKAALHSPLPSPHVFLCMQG